MKAWLEYRDQIEKALDLAGRTHTFQDVEDALLEGRARLFVAGRGLVICEVEQYPRKRVCRLWLAAGDMSDVLSLEDDIASWAHALGCETMVISGRKGWSKALPAVRWRQTLAQYEREV